MPRLTIDDRTADVPMGQRLVLAIKEQGINIGHRCGGKARCITCRVAFLSGEPDTMCTIEKPDWYAHDYAIPLQRPKGADPLPLNPTPRGLSSH